MVKVENRALRRQLGRKSKNKNLNATCLQFVDDIKLMNLLLILAAGIFKTMG